MKYWIRLFLPMMIYSMVSHGQNHVSNSGFEFPDYGNLPQKSGQANEISAWYSNITCYGGIDYDGNFDNCATQPHSPDWWSTRQQTEWPYQAYPFEETASIGYETDRAANSGYSFVGMAAGELIQHRIYEDLHLTEGQTYYLSFYIRLFQDDVRGFATGSTFEQARLRIYLSANELSYTCNDEDDNCWSLETSFLNKSDPIGQNIIVIDDVPLTLNQYPLYEWHQVTVEFIAPEDHWLTNAHDWLSFELQDWGEDVCNSYIGIDDVSLWSCSPHSCSSISGELAPVFSGSHYDSEPWRIDNIGNVSKLNLEIWPMLGGDIAEFSVECEYGFPNGWQWSGQSAGGEEFAAATYIYKLTAQNECWSVDFSGTFVKLNSNQNPTEVTPLFFGCGGVTYVPPFPCCPYEPIIYVDGQNWVEQDLTIHATEKIIVASIAPVVVGTNSNVVMRAGERIELNPGFSTDGMESFIAEIVPCPNYRLSEESTVYNEQEIIETEIANKDVIEPDVKLVTVYPNPTTGLLTLAHSQQLITVEVYDPLGRQLLQTAPNTTTTSIDLSGQPAGIYIIRAGLEDGSIETHRVVLSPP